MTRFTKALMMLATFAGLPALAGYDSYRALSFVIDNKTKENLTVGVDAEWGNGRAFNGFNVSLPAGGGNGFNVPANCDLHNPSDRYLNQDKAIRPRILQFRLKGKVFKTVDMTDMFGNKKNQVITGPTHFVVNPDFTIGVFQYKDAKGGW